MKTIDTKKLRQYLDLREQCEALETELGFRAASLPNGVDMQHPRVSSFPEVKQKRKMSAKGRAAIARAARARWRKAKAAGRNSLG